MKTVFLCIPTLASAGAQRFVTELACNIDKKKYRVIVVVTNKLDKKASFYNKLITEGIEVVDVSDLKYLQEAKKIFYLIKKENPSIIHTNVGAALHMLLPILISRTKAVHIFTVHSMGYRIFSGFKKKIMNFCFHNRIIIPVAICDTVKKSVEDAYHLPSDKVECVYNGVDTNNFNKCLNIKNDNFTFICVGTLYNIKNQEFLINAFKIVNDKIPSTKLLLVGDGELRKDLEELTQKLNLQDKIFFLGNQSDVGKYLSSSDAYCCSSKVEGLPISVLEAMSCSLPVVTTKAGGVVDVVKNGINGFVVETYVLEYANKMIEIVQNEDLRVKMGKSSRDIALKYNLENCVRGYEDLYSRYTLNYNEEI